ncbi:MAG: carbamoyltransferase C-terminal domain-containing protein [Myxococcota bacterium]|nr:carbamoyltransferase C-terminal domain-containing protein [Myxococcota bacterium]
MRAYVGLASTVHDPALAIVGADGEVRFAEATERSLQYKRAWHCPPDEPMRVGRLLREHVRPGEALVVAHSWERRRLRSPLFRAGFAAVEARVSPLLRPTMLGQMNSFDLAGKNLALRLFERDPAHAPIDWRWFDHHTTHAATACFGSGWGEATCAIVDANGERSSMSFFDFEGGALRPLGPKARRSFARQGSLGAFYAALCVACGFDPLKGEEWKVMGLAPYGSLDPALHRTLRAMLRVDGLQVRGNNWKNVAALHALRRPEGAPALDWADVAHTGQRVFGEVMSELLTQLHREAPRDRLVLSGGCALNSAFNGQIVERTPFREVFVPSAPADDGNAVGAAWLALAADGGAPPRRRLSPYLGSALDPEAIARVEALGGLRARATDDVDDAAAALLAAGKIVAVARGRAEYGPRALGNRSILADPRDPDVKERLNARVKFREEFRPFAPSILDAHGDAWFEGYAFSPHMERALRFRPEVRDRVPGVVHVDGTGRLQSVRAEDNPAYARLLERFFARTGVPLVLNTSFNVMGKPIVHAVEDAIAVFFTSGIDALLLEDQLFVKGDG